MSPVLKIQKADPHVSCPQCSIPMRARHPIRRQSSGTAIFRENRHHVPPSAARCHHCGSLLHHRKLAVAPLSPRRLTKSWSVLARGREGPEEFPNSGNDGKPTSTSAASMKVPDEPLVVKCAYISWCACLGTLARLYTDDIRPGNVALQGSFLSNAIGTFALGVMHASDISEANLPGLYTGLTVGLCGSYTTYSGWNLRIARAALRDASGPGGGIVAAVWLLSSLAFYAACYVAAKDLVKRLTERGTWGRCRGWGAGQATSRRAIGVVVSVYVVLALLLAFDENWSRRVHWVACMFAPLGALFRFSLSRQLNDKVQEGRFPLGTFVANIAGSLAMRLIFYGQGGTSKWRSVVLQAFRGGFLGSLTTMSTFISEVVGHRDRFSPLASYVYLAATAVGALVVVLIVGAALS